MKQTKLWLTTIAALLCSLTVNAYDFRVNGISYEIISDTTVCVTYNDKYTSSGGTEYNRVKYDGDVIIPQEVTYGNITYSVTSIGNYAFYNCSSLTAITIPKSVRWIGGWAFEGCSSLADVYCYAEKVPLTDSYAFYDSNNKNAILHVPASALETYKTTAPWSSFGTIVALTEEAGVEQMTIDKQGSLAEGKSNSQLTIYDLSGRRVENPEKGIYIVNGKKVIVK